MTNDDLFTGLRWNNASYYSTLAQQHTLKMETGLAKEAELTKGGKLTREELDTIGSELSDVCQLILNSAVSSIVFAGMASEAYIYDYAVRHLGKSYTDNHLDNLNVESKWVVIPRLVTGKPFPKDRQAFQLLKGLIKSRNFLVHHKSRDAHKSEITSEAIERRNVELHENARNAIKTLKLLGEEIEAIHADEPASFYLGFTQLPT